MMKLDIFTLYNTHLLNVWFELKQSAREFCAKTYLLVQVFGDAVALSPKPSGQDVHAVFTVSHLLQPNPVSHFEIYTILNREVSIVTDPVLNPMTSRS